MNLVKYILLLFQAMMLCGCAAYKIAMARLPVRQIPDVIANAPHELGQPVQVYGRMTLINFDQNRYVINNGLAFDPIKNDRTMALLKELHVGQEVVVRGYLKKQRGSYPEKYILKVAYYNPYNILLYRNAEPAKVPWW